MAKGDFLALMGPSGSGKTTLLNLIAGIDSPTSGTLRIGGNDVAKLSRAQLAKWRSRHVGYIFQLYHLVPILSAFENVELPLLLTKMSKTERREKVNSALELVGPLRPIDSPPNRTLRRARAAGSHRPCPSFTIPTSLSPTSRPEISTVNPPTRFCPSYPPSADDHGKTIVMVTHDPKAAAAAKRTLHLEKGQLATALS